MCSGHGDLDTDRAFINPDTDAGARCHSNTAAAADRFSNADAQTIIGRNLRA